MDASPAYHATLAGPCRRGRGDDGSLGLSMAWYAAGAVCYAGSGCPDKQRRSCCCPKGVWSVTGRLRPGWLMWRAGLTAGQGVFVGAAGPVSMGDAGVDAQC